MIGYLLMGLAILSLVAGVVIFRRRWGRWREFQKGQRFREAMLEREIRKLGGDDDSG